MRFRRSLLCLFLFLLALFALTAPPTLAQNLLVNPGFDRDLSGWDQRTYFNYTGNPGASAAWDKTDALSGNSGSARFQLRGFKSTVNRVLLSQCVAAVPGRRYTGGGMVRTDEQLLRGVIVRLEVFTSAGCAGDPISPGPPDGYSLTPMLYTQNDSQGRWLPASVSVVAGAGVQSLRFSAGIDAITFGSLYTLSSFDGLLDGAYLVEQTDPVATWILPSSAKVSGAAGSSWTTTLTLANGGADDALVTLKFLGHDVDGGSGDEKSLLIRAGTTVVFPDVVGSLFGRTQDFGAIRVTSLSAGVAVQSETSTPSSSGTVGQALPAFGLSDLAGATPKTLAPVRENASFRTNLVLANATEAPLTAHVVLFAPDGTSIGSRDVELPPLGMTQLNRVAAALGASTLDLGRIAVSTPTPGGFVAAYVSVIDNVSNDPRAFLPGRTPLAASDYANLLANSGFDHGIDGWTLTKNTVGHGTASAGWSPQDSQGSSGSGSAAFSANAPGANPSGDGASASLSQCVAVSGGTAYSLRARVYASVWGFLYYPRPGLSARFFGNGDCTGAVLEERGVVNQPLDGRDFNGQQWLTETTSFGPAPSGSSSALISLSAGAGGSVHGDGISVLFDDVFFGGAPSAWKQLLPSSARINGINDSFWTTDLALVNSGPEDATAYFLGKVLVIPAGQLLYLQDVLGWAYDVPGQALPEYRGYGPLEITSTSSGVSVQSQTSTPLQTGGTAGESLVALGADDFIGGSPKDLAPVRETSSFRTNLVLVNTSQAPLTVHVELFDASGASLGSTDVDLLPLEMKQFNQFAGTYGIWNLDAGRISVSTATPGGLVAAYASVIDNATNDPRTLLPH